MYLERAIESLTERIRWAAPEETSFPLTLDASNGTGTSGRTFKAFHQLVTIENVYAAISNLNPTAEDFNAILSDIIKQAVLSIVPLIIDKSINSVYRTDYTDLIIDNSVLFDDAIGYQVAISVLELFMSTKRSNLPERNAKLAISNLKLEINGFRNDNGHVIARGLIYDLKDALKLARYKLFPTEVIINAPKYIW